MAAGIHFHCETANCSHRKEHSSTPYGGALVMHKCSYSRSEVNTRLLQMEYIE